MPGKTYLVAVLLLLLCVGCGAQDNPITNGGFETLDDQGVPVDWQIMGRWELTETSHSGRYAIVIERVSAPPGESGLNRLWELGNGEQGTMLSQLKGGVKFWYRAEVASSAEDLNFEVIAMSAAPVENTGEQRARYRIPMAHVGDGQWHQGLLKYDFTANEKVKWVHISPRLRGPNCRMALDDIEWVPSVGPAPRIAKMELEETPGKEGEDCRLKVKLENAGDREIGVGLAALTLPEGMSPEGGPMRTAQALAPDASTQLVWRVLGPRRGKGRMTVTVTADDRTVTESIDYGPQLEVVGLEASPFVLFVGKPGTVTLKLRNCGHAMVEQVSADLRPGVPVAVYQEERRKRLDRIRPQTEAQFAWQVAADAQTPAAAIRASVSAANSQGGRATCQVLVGPDVPLPANLRTYSGVVTEGVFAAIENNKVRVAFPRAEFGYGIGIVQRAIGGRWQTVATMPRMTRLVAPDADGKPIQQLVYADAVRAIDSPEAVGPQMLTRRLELRGEVTDAQGVTWTITQTLSLRPGASMVGIDLEAVPNRPARLLALDGPMVYAGEGSPEGTRRLDAIFPGLEWLVEGEQSSSTLDIAEGHPHQVRYVPHPHMVTIPVMTARIAPPASQATTVALMWEHLAPYYGKLNRPSAAFASPDRFQGRASTLMGLFAPSMPEYIDPNQLTAHTPLEVAPQTPVRLSASLAALPAPAGATALDGVKLWADTYPLPDPNPLPHADSLEGEIEFSMASYLRPLWEPKAEKWYGSIGGPGINTPSWSPSYLYDMRVCLEACEDPAVVEQVRERYDRVVGLSGLAPDGDDMGFHYAGPVERVAGYADQVAALIRSQGEDGAWRFHARVETQGVFKGMDYAELGPDKAAEVGTCAHNAWEVLRFARMTGDKAARAAGIRALAFMDQFQVPRAAQVWEVPVHTPDILASAEACEAYLEGYKITGDEDYLKKAVYWAWTGLPFLYMWDVEGFEFLKYASIPVFGATWYQGSWFGCPVQWNGIRYANALFDLARYDNSAEWDKVARGITISCMYQQSEDEKDEGMWPDNISAITKAKCGWIFAPRMILRNVYTMMGMEPAPQTATARVVFDQIRINAAGRVSDADHTADTVSFKVTYTPPQTGFALVCNCTKPQRVDVNGEQALEVDRPAEADAPSWRYVEAYSMLELRFKGTGENKVRLTGITYQPSVYTPEQATQAAFDFSDGADGWRPTHHLASFTARGGVLYAQTTGPDPYMVRANCAIPAETVSALKVRMSIPAGAISGGQLFWTTASSPDFDEAKSLRFDVIADGEFHEYAIPVGEHEQWKGTISALRLDPTGGDVLGAVRVDYVMGE